MNHLVPIVIEKSIAGERSWDIFSRLLKERIIFINGVVDDNSANVIIAQLLHLEHEDKTKDIQIYINSPGGSVTAGLAIYDTMHFITAKVATICVGQAMSMGSLLLAAGEPGLRCALTNSRIMIHQPHGGTQGQAVDVDIYAKEIIYTKKQITKIYAQHTGQNLKVIDKLIDRDTFLSADKALKLGLIDQIIANKHDIKGS